MGKRWANVLLLICLKMLLFSLPTKVGVWLRTELLVENHCPSKSWRMFSCPLEIITVVNASPYSHVWTLTNLSFSLVSLNIMRTDLVIAPFIFLFFLILFWVLRNFVVLWLREFKNVYVYICVSPFPPVLFQFLSIRRWKAMWKDPFMSQLFTHIFQLCSFPVLSGKFLNRFF